MARPEDPAHLELDVDPGVEPIQGWLRMGGLRRRFSGWLELASALERARTTTTSRTAATEETQEGTDDS